MVVNSAKKCHSAKFLGPRPPHRPEISVWPKIFVFPPLGDVAPTFVFIDNDVGQKKNFFFVRYVHVSYN